MIEDEYNALDRNVDLEDDSDLESGLEPEVSNGVVVDGSVVNLCEADDPIDLTSLIALGDLIMGNKYRFVIPAVVGRILGTNKGDRFGLYCTKDSFGTDELVFVLKRIN